jgi:hypothetical protein
MPVWSKSRGGDPPWNSRENMVSAKRVAREVVRLELRPSRHHGRSGPPEAARRGGKRETVEVRHHQPRNNDKNSQRMTFKPAETSSMDVIGM